MTCLEQWLANHRDITIPSFFFFFFFFAIGAISACAWVCADGGLVQLSGGTLRLRMTAGPRVRLGARPPSGIIPHS